MTVRFEPALTSGVPGCVPVSEVPRRLDRWEVEVSDDGSPHVHVGGGGFGLVVRDTQFPAQRGFLKCTWWYNHELDDIPFATDRRRNPRDRRYSVLVTPGMVSPHIPAALGLTDVPLSHERFEPALVTKYWSNGFGQRSRTLEEHIAEHGPLSGGASLRLAVCLFAALKCCQRGWYPTVPVESLLVHCDIKPANLLVHERDWVFALIDCDDACVVRREGHEWRSIDYPMITERWAAPELLSVSRRASVSDDSWLAFSSLVADSQPTFSPSVDVWGAALVIAWATWGGNADEFAANLPGRARSNDQMGCRTFVGAGYGPRRC